MSYLNKAAQQIVGDCPVLADLTPAHVEFMQQSLVQKNLNPVQAVCILAMQVGNLKSELQQQQATVVETAAQYNQIQQQLAVTQQQAQAAEKACTKAVPGRSLVFDAQENPLWDGLKTAQAAAVTAQRKVRSEAQKKKETDPGRAAYVKKRHSDRAVKCATWVFNMCAMHHNYTIGNQVYDDHSKLLASIRKQVVDSIFAAPRNAS
ncbi:hypothetical protein H9P43_003808 [Blastocladiella emersonii ATCC 22665]|nr:hypothetical protein H9P43_003808 [Blastocladiella emersonii ATCC 22665]